MGTDMLRDVEVNTRKKLNILEAVQRLNKPLLVLHGQNDETVPYFEAEQLNVFANPEHTTLQLIPKGTHTFGATHPPGEVPAPLSMALEFTGTFFQQHLST